jgi:hypothetical protein
LISFCSSSLPLEKIDLNSEEFDSGTRCCTSSGVTIILGKWLHALDGLAEICDFGLMSVPGDPHCFECDNTFELACSILDGDKLDIIGDFRSSGDTDLEGDTSCLRTSGDIDLNGDISCVNSDFLTSGDIDLEGETSFLNSDFRTSGDIDLDGDTLGVNDTLLSADVGDLDGDISVFNIDFCSSVDFSHMIEVASLCFDEIDECLDTVTRFCFCNAVCVIISPTPN